MLSACSLLIPLKRHRIVSWFVCTVWYVDPVTTGVNHAQQDDYESLHLVGTLEEKEKSKKRQENLKPTSRATAFRRNLLQLHGRSESIHQELAIFRSRSQAGISPINPRIEQYQSGSISKYLLQKGCFISLQLLQSTNAILIRLQINHVIHHLLYKDNQA